MMRKWFIDCTQTEGLAAEIEITDDDDSGLRLLARYGGDEISVELPTESFGELVAALKEIDEQRGWGMI